jgi:hypothetical protein
LFEKDFREKWKENTPQPTSQRYLKLSRVIRDVMLMAKRKEILKFFRTRIFQGLDTRLRKLL